MAAAWTTMWVYWVALALAQIPKYGLGMMLPAMTQELGLGPVQAGTLGAVGWLATAAFLLPISGWVTRFPPKLTMGCALGIMSVSYFLAAATDSFIVLLITRSVFILGAFFSLVNIALLQRQWFYSREMGTLKGLENFMFSMGQVVALAGVPAAMALLGGWRPTLGAVGVAMALVAIAWFAFARERPGGLPSAEGQHPAAERSTIRDVLRNKAIVLLAIGMLGNTFAYVAFFTFWPTYVLQERGISLELSGLMLGTCAVGAAVGALLAGALSDRIGLRRPQPIIQGLLLPVMYVALIRLDSVPALWATAAVTGVVMHLGWPIVTTIPFELPRMRPQQIALGIGLIHTLINLGGAVGAQLVGVLVEPLGMGGALLSVSFAPLLLAVCVALVPETGPRARAAR